METDVIVIGAGPAGLTLAAELRLGGADVVVFEQRAERSWESRGIGFTARATEMFHQRGILERLENIEITRQGHFGGIPIDYGVLEGSHFGVRGAPQYKIEEMLENRALELGVTLRRGYELTGLTDTGDGVTAVVEGPDGPEECSARYLVGCDGGRSTVRRLVGIEFMRLRRHPRDVPGGRPRLRHQAADDRRTAAERHGHGGAAGAGLHPHHRL